MDAIYFYFKRCICNKIKMLWDLTISLNLCLLWQYYSGYVISCANVLDYKEKFMHDITVNIVKLFMLSF